MGGAIEILNQPQQPDLLDALADQQATVFGMTGTVRQLADMCPVDLSDPAVSLEAKNDFVVKLANESELEVPEAYREVFEETTARLGLEQKYSIAPQEPVEHHERQEPNQHEQKPIATENLPDTPAERTAAAVEITDKLNAEEVLRQQAQVRELEIAAEQTQILQETINESNPNPETDQSSTEAERQLNVVERAESNELVQIQEQLAEAEPEPIVLFSRVEDKVLPQVVIVESQEPVHFEPLERSVLPEEDELEVQFEESASNVEEKPTAQAIEQWEAELYKEPAEIFDDFAQAIEAYAQVQDESATDVEAREASESRRVMQQLAENLVDLEPRRQEEIGETMRQIAGAMHGIQLLEQAGAPAEQIEEVHRQLTELCETLCEQAGLELTPEEIELLVRAIQEIELGQPANELVDLTVLGTHEAKHAAQPHSDYTQDTQPHRSLGMLTLFYAGLGRNMMAA